MPRVSFADRKQAVLHFVRDRGLPGAKPRFRRRPPIIGMNDSFPICVADRSVPLAERICVFDAAIGSRRPHQLRQTVGEKPEMLFAASQFLLGLALLLCSQSQQLGGLGQGVGEAVKLTNASRRRGDRRAGQHVLRLGFEVSNSSSERTAIEKGQKQAAKDRKRRQERREEKRARTNSEPACDRRRRRQSNPPPPARRLRPLFVRQSHRELPWILASFASHRETQRWPGSLARPDPTGIRATKAPLRSTIPASQVAGKF